MVGSYVLGMTRRRTHQNSNSSTILSNKKEKEVTKHKVHVVLFVTTGNVPIRVKD